MLRKDTKEQERRHGRRKGTKEGDKGGGNILRKERGLKGAREARETGLMICVNIMSYITEDNANCLIVSNRCVQQPTARQ